MKRMRILGPCLLAALAAAAVLCVPALGAPPEFGRCVAKAGGKYATSACTTQAAGKEKYEWEPGPGPKNKFTSKMPSGDKATLESEKKTKVVCTGASGFGEIANAKEVAHTVAIFTGCEFSSLKCSTSGQAEGEIRTVEMGGKIGIEKEGTKGPVNAKVAEELKPESGELFVTFNCVGTEIKVKGSILHPISADKMLSSETEKFTESKGKNKPDKFEGDPEQDLMAKFGAAGEYEHSGQTTTTVTTLEEKLEANTVV